MPAAAPRRARPRAQSPRPRPPPSLTATANATGARLPVRTGRRRSSRRSADAQAHPRTGNSSLTAPPPLSCQRGERLGEPPQRSTDPRAPRLFAPGAARAAPPSTRQARPAPRSAPARRRSRVASPPRAGARARATPSRLEIPRQLPAGDHQQPGARLPVGRSPKRISRRERRRERLRGQVRRRLRVDRPPREKQQHRAGIAPVEARKRLSISKKAAHHNQSVQQREKRD